MQFFTTDFLSKINGGAKSEEYWNSITKVRQHAGREYSEIIDFASYKDFQERTILDENKVKKS